MGPPLGNAPPLGVDWAMPNENLHEEIEELEAHIEALSEIAAGCRKWMLLAKIASGLGCAWLVASLFGLVRSELSLTLLAIAAALGGIVLGGSNFSTLRRASDAIAAAEALRVRIIDAAALPSVGSTVGPRQLH